MAQMTVEALRAMLADDSFARSLVDMLNGDAPEVTEATAPEAAAAQGHEAPEEAGYLACAPEVFRTPKSGGQSYMWAYSPLTKHQTVAWMRRYGVGIAEAGRVLGVPESTLRTWTRRDAYRRPAWDESGSGRRTYDRAYVAEVAEWAKLARTNGLPMGAVARATGVPTKTLEGWLGTGGDAKARQAVDVAGLEARLARLEERMDALEGSLGDVMDGHIDAFVDAMLANMDAEEKAEADGDKAQDEDSLRLMA